MKITQCADVNLQNITHKFPVLGLGVNRGIHKYNCSVVLAILHYLLSIIDFISDRATSLVVL